MRFIFRAGDALHGAQLGGKASALLALRENKLPIPEWFVVLPGAFIASTGEASSREHTLAPEVMSELNSALAELCPAGELVAVRSSALDEDGGQHSFAGQLESYLSVPPVEVAPRIAAVWKSASSARVQAYREQRHVSAPLRAPAVLIQLMVHADAAGVAFGADPVTGREDIAVVSAVHGLGSALVNGEIDTDTWHVDASERIIQRRPTGQRPALNDTQVLAVVELVRRTGEIFGQPQDVEWAIEGDHLYLLQSRPITTLPNRGKLNIWDNSNIIESYSGVTTPLTFSFVRRAYEGVYRQFCQMLAVQKAKIAAHDQTFRHMLGLIRGRVYYNLLNWYRVLALLPGFTLNRRFMEQMMGVKEELPAEIVAELRRANVRDKVKDGFDLAFSLAAFIANHFLLPLKIRRFYARLNETLAPPPTPLEAMTADELAAYFLTLEKKLLTRWDAPLLNDFFAMIFHGMLRRLTCNWAGDSAGTLQNDLLCGEGGMISAEPARRIRSLAELACADARFVTLLCEGAPSAILGAMASIPGFGSAYREYLEKFSDRCLEDLKLESLTLHDDPLMLLRAIGRLARSCANGTHNLLADRTDERANAEARVRQALAGRRWQGFVFHWVLRHARARVRDRENLRFERTRLYGRVRRIFVELGRRLQAQGHLHDPRDIFFLEIDEALGFVGGTAATTKLKELVALRQAEFAEYRATAAPPNRLTTRGVVSSMSTWSDIKPMTPIVSGDRRQGIGCCPGRVRGRVRKVTDPRNAPVQPGEILVAERTDPGWIMLFPAAAGLLVERGSLLSHSAIVARELRLPTIVSIDGLMAWLNNGDLVEFDGSTGAARRIEVAWSDANDIAASPQPMPEAFLPIRAEEPGSTILAR
jgi:phosphohistidine swiveling domain-containing protein